MSAPDLDAIKRRAADDGPGANAGECIHCGDPLPPEPGNETCEHNGGFPCEDPDADDVCREDRGALLLEVDRLVVRVRELETELAAARVLLAAAGDAIAEGARLRGALRASWQCLLTDVEQTIRFSESRGGQQAGMPPLINCSPATLLRLRNAAQRALGDG